MQACRMLAITPSVWRAMPDGDKDDVFSYLAWRDEQIAALRDRLIEKKAADPSALTMLYLAGL